MIVSKRKPLNEILDALGEIDAVFLLGCGDCATACASGGRRELDEASRLLQEQGRTVTGSCIPETACVAAQLKFGLAAHLDEIRRAKAILVFACGLGVSAVHENDRFGKTVLPACDTLFAATVDGKGVFKESCSLCGACLLGKTAGVCPVTRCAKGLLNGPCGGMNAGKCEVDTDKDCAWAVIFGELEKKGTIQKMREIVPPHDFRKNRKPRVFVKEE